VTLARSTNICDSQERWWRGSSRHQRGSVPAGSVPGTPQCLPRPGSAASPWGARSSQQLADGVGAAGRQGPHPGARGHLLTRGCTQSWGSHVSHRRSVHPGEPAQPVLGLCITVAGRAD